MRHFIFGLLLTSLLINPAFAQKPKAVVKSSEKVAETLASTDPDSVPVLQKIKGDNKNLTYDYLGERFGINAWLLSGPNVMQIVYTGKNSDGAMIGGALVGPDGKEISSAMTKEFMTQYPERAQEILITVRQKAPAAKDDKTAEKAPSRAEILWQKLQQGGQINFGPAKDAPVVFAMLDPAAPVTKEVWAHLGPLAKADKITLHILPLGLTTADSIMEIASTLGDKDPKTAWENLMQGKSAIKEETPDSAGVTGMKANVDLAQSMHLRDLPLLVYRDKSDRIRIVQGVPKDWKEFTKEINPFK